MRDEHSNKNAQRQAAFAERQREMGRKKYSYWMRPEEAEKVAKFLENLRLENPAILKTVSQYKSPPPGFEGDF